jgi:DNA-binding transcriptional LysR family regulator
MPTARAEALWPIVRQAMSGLQQAFAPAQYAPDRDAAHFRLAMADATAAMLMPPLVQGLEQVRALANLRVMPLTTRDPRRLLAQSEIDLAVGHFPEVVGALVTQGEDALWQRERLYTSEYVCVMRRGHPLAEQELTLERYIGALHLLVSFSGRAQGLVDEALSALGRQRRVVLTVNQFFTAGRVVARSDLLTVLPASFIAATGYRHEVVARPLPLSISPVYVDMLWHRRSTASPPHRWLRELVAAAARRSPPNLRELDVLDANASTPPV